MMDVFELLDFMQMAIDQASKTPRISAERHNWLKIAEHFAVDAGIPPTEFQSWTETVR